MRNSGKEFPYPVLCKENNSILNSSLDFTYSIVENKNLKCVVKVVLKNKDIRQLISKNKAKYAVLIECSKTHFRKVILSKESNFEFEILEENLKNKVEISSMIITTKDIKYSNRNFDEDSEGESYFIPKNNILAYDTDITFEVERNVDLMENLPSIFVIIENKEDKAPSMKLDLNDSKIKILLNPKSYESYKALRGNQQFEELLCSIFIVPALTNILSQLNELEEEYGHTNWYHSVITRLNSIGADKEVAKDEALRYSQEILGNTFQKTLETLELLSMEG